MKNLLLCTAALSLVSGCYPVHASPCDYDHVVKSKYIQTIEETKNFKTEVFDYVEDTRKCVVTMTVKIADRYYPTRGEFVFSPTMSQVEACAFAEERAKSEIIRKISPQTLTAETDMQCNLQQAKKDPINNEVVTITKSEPEVISERVYIDGVLVETRESNVVKLIKPIRPGYNPDPTSYRHGDYDNSGITLTSVFSILFGNL